MKLQLDHCVLGCSQVSAQLGKFITPAIGKPVDAPAQFGNFLFWYCTQTQSGTAAEPMNEIATINMRDFKNLLRI